MKMSKLTTFLFAFTQPLQITDEDGEGQDGQLDTDPADMFFELEITSDKVEISQDRSGNGDLREQEYTQKTQKLFVKETPFVKLIGKGQADGVFDKSRADAHRTGKVVVGSSQPPTSDLSVARRTRHASSL
jgi:hypothetical protein